MTVYSGTTCPMCKMLIKLLKEKNIEFDISYNTRKVAAMGFRSLPVTEINGEYKDIKQMMRYLNEQN